MLEHMDTESRQSCFTLCCLAGDKLSKVLAISLVYIHPVPIITSMCEYLQTKDTYHQAIVWYRIALLLPTQPGLSESKGLCIIHHKMAILYLEMDNLVLASKHVTEGIVLSPL